MFSFRNTMSSKSTSNFDENRWIINICQTLDEELDDDDSDIPVCIFNVPKTLLSTDPDSYTPQQVAIGPYHYWRSDLYEMERYKIVMAKKVQNQLQKLKLKHLVDQFKTLETRIRACYHKYLDYSSETLAWMMTVDSSFLLEFLQIYADFEERKMLRRVSSHMSHLVDYAGRKLGHNAILRDIVMLENQIPLFVLRKMLEFQFSSLELADEKLISMLTGFSKEVSLFVAKEDLPKIKVQGCNHILDFLYQTIIPNFEEQLERTIEIEDEFEEKRVSETNRVKKFLKLIWHYVFVCPIHFIKRVVLPILVNLPGFAICKVIFDNVSPNQETKNEVSKSAYENNIDKPPLVEEITIPSVSQLTKSGVKFVPTNGNISTINFEAKTKIFFLPKINLDVNTNIVLRNLVAYEASNTSGPLFLARYTELMNGIIDTEEDVRLLREQGIILNRLKSDEEAANLWNGMSKSVKLTKVSFLDKLIEDVNKYYNNRWMVKGRKFIKRYVYSSWQFLTFVAVLLFLFLLSLLAFCSFRRLFLLRSII